MKIRSISELESDMVAAISKYYIFSYHEVYDAFVYLESFDKVIEVCNYASMYGYSSLWAAYQCSIGHYRKKGKEK